MNKNPKIGVFDEKLLTMEKKKGCFLRTINLTKEWMR